MSSRRLQVASPIGLLFGCLALVVIVAGLSRLMPREARPAQMVAPVASQGAKTVMPAPVSTSTEEVAIALGGDMLQSIPPSWTFTFQDEDPTDAGVFDGAVVHAAYSIRSNASRQSVQIVQYTITNYTAFIAGIKPYAEWKVGNRTVHLLKAKDAGKNALLIEGTYQAAVISLEDLTEWPKQPAALPEEIRTLVQAIRLQ